MGSNVKQIHPNVSSHKSTYYKSSQMCTPGSHAATVQHPSSDYSPYRRHQTHGQDGQALQALLLRRQGNPTVLREGLKKKKNGKRTIFCGKGGGGSPNVDKRGGGVAAYG